ncbi:hypothetical protein BJV74DRAFT_817443, partial [Russula compacta]
MSAYGTIAVTSRPLLPPTSWDLPQSQPGKPAAPFRRLALHHLRLDGARTVPGLLEYTHRVFADEIEAGRTYPQEPEVTVAAGAEQVDSSSLSNNDLSAAADDRGDDAAIGIGIGIGTAVAVKDTDDDMDTDTDTDKATSPLSRRCGAYYYSRAAFETYFWAADVIIAVGLAWDVQCAGIRRLRALGGVGKTRSSGFTMSSLTILDDLRTFATHHWQFDYGMTLGKSYLHYGPSLGYKAS